MKHSVFYTILVAFTVFSCSKDRIDPTPKLNRYEPISTYFKTQKSPEQIFEITENDDIPIQGLQGTKVWLPKGLLMFPDGQDVDYPYTIKLVEAYCPKDMMYYQKPTTAHGNIVETEGEVRIRAFKENDYGKIEELVLKPGETFLLQMPSDSARHNLKVLYDITSNNIPDWTSEAGDAGANIEADLYFSKTDTAHRANIGKLDWINCGTLHQAFYKLSFASEVDDLTNVGIFGYIPKYKTLVQAYRQKTPALPDSCDIKIIAIGIDKDKKLYYQGLRTLVTHSGTVPIKLKPISNVELRAVLDELEN